MTRFFTVLLALVIISAPALAAEDTTATYDGFGAMFAGEAGVALDGDDDAAMIAAGESLSEIAPAAGDSTKGDVLTPPSEVAAPVDTPVQAVDDSHSVTVPVEIEGQSATE